MKVSKQKNKKISYLFIGFLLFLSLSINITYIFHPLLIKRFVSKIYKPHLNQTLQKLEGPLISQEIYLRVLKVKFGNKVHLEFLSKQPDNSFLPINSLELKGNREAYFTAGKRGKTLPPSSLLLLDVDGDGALDILAPTFNNFFHPYLNVASYNKKTKKFELKERSPRPKIVPRPSSVLNF